MDYEPLEQVKRLTLDYKLEKRIQAEQQRILEKQEEGKGSVSKANLTAGEREAVKQQQTLIACNKAIKAVKDGVTDRNTLVRLVQPLLNASQNVNQFLDQFVGEALIDKLEKYKQSTQKSAKQSPQQTT